MEMLLRNGGESKFCFASYSQLIFTGFIFAEILGAQSKRRDGPDANIVAYFSYWEATKPQPHFYCTLNIHSPPLKTRRSKLAGKRLNQIFLFLAAKATLWDGLVRVSKCEN